MYILAQTIDTATQMPLAPWAQLTGTAAIIMLFIWLITKGMPDLLNRHDKIQEATISRFEAMIERIDTRRETTAKAGHDAAANLATAIKEQTGQVAENTDALRALTANIPTRG